MATINTGYTFVSGEIVTPSKLNDAVNSAQVSGIVNANISGTAGIVDTKLASIATPGKVANTATTATTANVPSAIVARDPNGDFTAGVITADLVGNADTATESEYAAESAYAETAGAATTANSAGYAATAGSATTATSADYATTAGYASTAGSTATTESSTNIIGGSAGQLICQASSGVTTFIDTGSAGQVLQSAGAGALPRWVENTARYVSIVDFEFTPTQMYPAVITDINQNPYSPNLIVTANTGFSSTGTFNLHIVEGFSGDNADGLTGVYEATFIGNNQYRLGNPFRASSSGTSPSPYFVNIYIRLGFPISTMSGGPQIVRNSFLDYSFVMSNIGNSPVGFCTPQGIITNSWIGNKGLTAAYIRNRQIGSIFDVRVLGNVDADIIQAPGLSTFVYSL